MDTSEVVTLYEKYALRHSKFTGKKRKTPAMAKFRLRVWEHIKATVSELKDRGRWDEVNMIPIPIKAKVTDINTPLWIVKGLMPGTDEWKDHWKRYPKEQTGMAKHSTRKYKEFKDAKTTDKS